MLANSWPTFCPLARSSRVGKRAGQDGRAGPALGPATLDGPAAGTRRPPRRRAGLIALVVCEATARRRRVRRRWRLAVRWDGGMVRADVGVVRDARAPASIVSPQPAQQARRRAARARLGAAAAPREAPSEGATPLSHIPSRARVELRFTLFFAPRPTLVGEDRPSSASRASSGASSSSGGASPMLPPAPSSQPARGPHRRPHVLTLVLEHLECSH